jgi:hypothetical protein
VNDFVEQRPGEQTPGMLGYRDKPLFQNGIPENWPCAKCHHAFGDHTFMYGVGISDKYRCQRAGCQCGKQYQAVAVMVRPDQINTDEKRIEIAKRLSDAKAREAKQFGE